MLLMDHEADEEGMLDREARRLTWSDVKWTMKIMHPRQDVQSVLRHGGRVLVVEYQQSVAVVGIRSNLGTNVLCPRLVCPVCRKATTVLWLDDYRRRIGCRKCNRVVYSSRRREPSDVFVKAKMELVDLYEREPERFNKSDEPMIRQLRAELQAQAR